MKRRISKTALLAARVLEGFREQSGVIADLAGAQPPDSRPVPVRSPRDRMRGEAQR